MAIFDRLDRMTSRAVDRVNAIPFQFIPMRSSPNGRGGPDPDRVALPSPEIPSPRGILDEAPTYLSVEIGKSDGVGNDLRTRVANAITEFSVDRRYWPTRELEPRQSDQIKLSGRDFEISSVRRDGLSRLVLQLVEMKP